MLFDLHVHSAEGSPCAKITNRELVRAYKEKGFDGFVLTNHVARWYMESSYRLSYTDYCKHLYDVYLDAKEKADKIGLKVFFGQELKLDTTAGNDYLLYGVTYEQLIDYGDMMSWSLSKLSEASKSDGFVFYQAHPFREQMRVIPHKDLYGMEVFNGSHDDHFIDNLASMWANKYNLHMIAGSDCHLLNTVGMAGVRFMSQIKDNNDLLAALKEDNYYLVENAIIAR